jgi:lipopolysaccharide export system protein LptA
MQFLSCVFKPSKPLKANLFVSFFRKSKTLLLLLVFLLVFAGSHCKPAKAEGEHLQINNADSLEIVEDKLILTGHVSVSTMGDNAFTLLTSKLIAFKDQSGEYSLVECFNRSEVRDKQYSLTADKIYIRKDASTKQFNLLDSNGNVKINSFDNRKKISSPKALIDIAQKMLFAKGGVVSEEVSFSEGQKQSTRITSQEQDISLASSPDKPVEVANLANDSEVKTTNKGKNKKATRSKGKPRIQSTDEVSKVALFKQLEARGEAQSEVSSEAKVFSEKVEVYTLDGSNEEVVFTGEANLLRNDGTKGEGESITYYPKTKKLKVLANASREAQITKTDGTIIKGDQVEFDSASNTLVVSRIRENGFKSFLAVPYDDNNSSNTESESAKTKPQSFMNVWADYIENKEKSEFESILTAHENKEDELVRIDYGDKSGFGKHLFVYQNKQVANKKDDFLILAEKAKLQNKTEQQEILAPVIRIGLGAKDLKAGFTSRASGYFPLKQTKQNANTGTRVQSPTRLRKL